MLPLQGLLSAADSAFWERWAADIMHLSSGFGLAKKTKWSPDTFNTLFANLESAPQTQDEAEKADLVMQQWLPDVIATAAAWLKKAVLERIQPEQSLLYLIQHRRAKKGLECWGDAIENAQSLKLVLQLVHRCQPSPATDFVSAIVESASGAYSWEGDKDAAMMLVGQEVEKLVQVRMPVP